MLRINLLPAYLAEKRKVNAAIAVCAAAFLIVVGGGLGYNYVILQDQVHKEEDLATAREADATAEQAYESATTQLRSKVAPLKEKVDFVEAVRYHNKIRQKIYRQAAAYTYKDVELNSMAVTGNTLSVGAVAKSLSDIGRFYIYMFGNPDVTAVSITGVPSHNDVVKQTPVTYPGGPRPLPPAFRVGMAATLVRPVAAPQLPASLSGGTGAAGGGVGGGVPPGVGIPPQGEESPGAPQSAAQ